MNYVYTNFTDYLLENKKVNNIALWDNGEFFTYKEIKDKAYYLATYFLYHGIQRGDKILYSLAPGMDFVISYLASAMIGAVFCGIPYNMPEIGIHKVIKELEPKLFLCEREFVEKYSKVFPSTVSIRNLTLKYYDEELVRMNKALVELDDPAFILYTSGTVHQPKGAILTHKNIIAECRLASRYLFKDLTLSEDDVFLHAFPVNHVSGCVECGIIPLYIGASIVFQKKFHPQVFLENIMKYKVTIVCGVPAMWGMLMDFMDAYQIQPFHVRGCLSGAAILKNKLKNRILELCDSFENPLGMTEASGFISYSNHCDNGSIGKIFDEIQYKIHADETGTGELLLKGDNIISGYYNCDIALDCDGYYHTNDMVYEDENHYIYLCGRNDDMFTVGGYCVHPSEIEEVILEYPGIKEALVLPIPHAKMGNVCRCYITVKGVVDINKLEQFAGEHLLSYKVPRNFVVLDQFPINLNGKIDKKLFTENIKKEFGLE